MTSVLDWSRLHLSAFVPEVAAALGDKRSEPGCLVLSETALQGRSRVTVRDWMYALVRWPESLLRRRLVDALRQTPESFVTAIEPRDAIDGEAAELPPGRMTLETVSPEVVTMLAEAERLAREAGLVRIDEAALTLAILSVLPQNDRKVLEAWATPDGLEDVIDEAHRWLNTVPRELPPFTESGEWNAEAFTDSGRRLCQCVLEEVSSLGARRVSTRSVLYALVGQENGLLTTALTHQGFAVSRDFHAVLVRELHRSRKRSAERPTLNREEAFGPVHDWLETAQRLAQNRRAEGIAACDLERAFAQTQIAEITRLVPPDQHWSVEVFQEYLRQIEPEDENVLGGDVRGCSPQDLELELQRSLFGQTQAVQCLLPWIKRLKFGLPRDDRPAGVFLFIGPTGTGKTQLAKELARCVFGSADELLFLEMGQFKTKESVSGLIGAPPGYVGYGEGKLTNGLRDNPRCVVLFDEIDKASTTVLDVVLRFADEGLISDPAGPVRDGRKCLVVMTTNAGQGRLLQVPAASGEAFSHNPNVLAAELQDAAERELRELGFRHEFLGRVDESVVFLPLNVGACRQIVDRVIDGELARLRQFKGIEATVAEEVRAHLSTLVHQRSLREGARSAPRVVHRSVLTPIIDLACELESSDGLRRCPQTMRAHLADDLSVRVEVVP